MTIPHRTGAVIRAIHPPTASVVLACCLVALAGCGESGGHVGSSGAPTVGVGAKPGALPKRSVVRKVAVGGAPIGLLAYAGRLWVADAANDRVLRVEPGSGRVTARVPVGRTPLRIIAFRGSIWSTDWKGGTVTVVSPAQLRPVATMRVGSEPEGIVPFGRDLWVVSERDGDLVRLAPGDPRPANRVHVGMQPRQVTNAGAELWVSVFGEDSVAEVDPRTRRVLARIRVCGGPQGLAYSVGQLWVGCTNSGQLVDVDTAARRVVHRIAYEAADGVTRAGSLLRVTSDDGPSTALLDPRTGQLAHRVRLADGFISDANADVVMAGQGAWVSSPDEGAVYRVPGS